MNLFFGFKSRNILQNLLPEFFFVNFSLRSFLVLGTRNADVSLGASSVEITTAEEVENVVFSCDKHIDPFALTPSWIFILTQSSERKLKYSVHLDYEKFYTAEQKIVGGA